MSDWDMEDLDTSTSGKSKKITAGPWDIGLTVTALLSVVTVSFLSAWLTKDVQSRPFWMLGLSFAAPVVALLLSVFIKEKISSSMTPSTSRNAQLILVGCSILAAAVVGCFCQVANEQADTFEEVVTGEGWSDVFIILDKSGSMSYTQWDLSFDRGEISETEYRKRDTSKDETLDQIATNAVIDLVGQMDDKTQVGLLIDVGWEENNEGQWIVPLSSRILPIAALTPEHRSKLISLAKFDLYFNENFPRAFDVACDVVREYQGQDGDLSIIIISDGQDCTEKFRAVDYADQLNSRKVKLNYLFVAPDYSEEMSKLAELTGGTSIYVNDRNLLLEQMKKMVSVPIITTVYKDALRNIDESPVAKTVTGILLLLLGLLIGISLTVMFSLQGQKRFQMILSPLMAVLAFIILAFGKELIPTPWIREGLAFSLFGIVLMRKNNVTGRRKTHPINNVQQEPVTDTDSEW